jgi:ubiquinone/menaquinone biosynthesis C-methylase UbiE
VYLRSPKITSILEDFPENNRIVLFFSAGTEATSLPTACWMFQVAILVPRQLITLGKARPRRRSNMSGKVDLYDSAYGNYESATYRQVRIETYGEDFGQTSWVTTEESNAIPQLLGLRSDSLVLEIGCGSGGYALHLGEKVGCRVIGLDINEAGVRNANHLALSRGLASQVRFEHCDASKKLPFDDNTFDAVFSNDVLCHLQRRQEVLAEIFRVLNPGGGVLFSDALVIGGMVSNEEIATRSSIGFYVYSPPGENERLMEQARFQHIRVKDTTESAARIAKRWYHAREKIKEELVAAEGDTNYEGLQQFLSCVHALTSEKRLLRYLYEATKAGSGYAIEQIE